MDLGNLYFLKYLIFMEFVDFVADRQGFEPWRRSPAYTLSRRAPSTTRPPVRGVRLARAAPLLQDLADMFVSDIYSDWIDPL